MTFSIFSQLNFTLINTGIIFLGLINIAQGQMESDPSNRPLQDATLSTQVKTQDNLNFTVTAGETRGNNLFHSFQQFSVPTNGSVSFNNLPTIENIINRVTGDLPSNIDGLIKTNGTANLFLINPHGIIFGNNAALNIGGSFLATTAESLIFEDGTEFSTNSNSSPLLTISVPFGLQFGSNPGTIINRSQTTIPNPVAQGTIKIGLSVLPEETLAFIAGDITLDGGVLTAPTGNIELTSVGNNSFVEFASVVDGFTFYYEYVSDFENILLDNLAIIDASSLGGGAINLNGKQIQVLNGSTISSNTLGDIDGKDINLNASELVEIKGYATDNTLDPFLEPNGILVPAPSLLSTNTFGQGNGGNINITTKNFHLLNGAEILLQTIGNPENSQPILGTGGKLIINASELVAIGGTRPLLGIKNVSNPFFVVDLETSIEIAQVSVISTAAFFSNSSSGNINIQTKNFTIEDGGIIATTPFGGEGGNISITATESVKITGVSSINPRGYSIISANTFKVPNSQFIQGNAGDINISTNFLSLKDGGGIATSTNNIGQGGNITINASEISVSGISPLRNIPSGIGSQASGEGNAGSILIFTDNIVVDQNANITAESSRSGASGNIEITGNSLQLNNQGSVTAETLSGEGGNIKLKLNENLILRNNSQISAQAFNIGQGGNIDIAAKFVIAIPSENSDILANAFQGDGGNINIISEGIIGITESNDLSQLSEINASSKFGQNGSVIIKTPDAEAKDPATDINLEVNKNENLLLNQYCRAIRNSKYVITGRSGIPLVDGERGITHNIWEDWRIIENDHLSSTISPNTNKYPVSLAPTESNLYPQLAQGWIVNKEGKIILTAEPLVITPHPQQVTIPGC